MYSMQSTGHTTVGQTSRSTSSMLAGIECGTADEVRLCSMLLRLKRDFQDTLCLRVDLISS
jgi:hypothetical protein